MFKTGSAASVLMLCLSLLLTTVACVQENASEQLVGPWAGDVLTEGNITTVLNKSGSLWTTPASLVEESSIGMETGPPEYLFGSVMGVAVTDDRTFVLDGRPPVVRVYDRLGQHVISIGAEGDGPGEFRRPTDIAVGPNGRTFVRQRSRISTFDRDGKPGRVWTGRAMSLTPLRMVISPGGVLYNPQVVGDGASGRGVGMVPYTDGTSSAATIMAPQFDHEVPLLGEAPGTRHPVPFWPTAAWALSPSGAMVSGVPTEYRFRISHPNGVIALIDRTIEAVRLESAESEWQRKKATAIIRSVNPGWVWRAPEIPLQKPFFEEFFADDSGRVWVRRKGPGVNFPGCDENPDPAPRQDIEDCWRDTLVVDLFGADGRYLGEVIFPEPIGRFRQMGVHGDRVVIQLEDQQNTFVVKTFRLVVPGT